VPQIDFRVEHWDEFWPDAAGLVQEEFDEHAVELGLRNPPVPDTAILSAIEQQRRLILTTARVNGAIGAYLAWIVDVDLESKGHTVYRQGPFYSSKRFTKYSLGVRLLRKSLELIRHNSLEAVEIELHHPPVGRGAKLRGVFTALGAIEVAVHYRLRVSRKD
jgi:hypothetical protein